MVNALSEAEKKRLRSWYARRGPEEFLSLSLSKERTEKNRNRSYCSGHRQTYDKIPEQIRKTRAALGTDNLLVSDYPFTDFRFSQRDRFRLALAPLTHGTG